MTSLVAWVGVDARGPSSLYVASDSRISWPNGSAWDHGRKLFAPASGADLFGYCGDVLFPALVLGQAAALASSGGMLRDPDATHRHHELVAAVQASFAAFPTEQRAPFGILHGARSGEGMSARLYLWQLSWSSAEGWSDTGITVPTHSDLLAALGSGKGAVGNHDFRWSKSQVGGTSRAIFGAFCDALVSRSDRLTGGAPQLVGLYRTGPAHTFGVVYALRPFVFGAPLDEAADRAAFEWRNEQFERCDPITLRILDAAQRQPRPSDLPFAAG